MKFNRLVNFFLKQINDVRNYGFKELLKKILLFSKISFNFVLNIFLGLIPVLLIRLLSPWYLVRIQRVPVIHFANFATDLALYLCKKKFGLDEPKINYLDLFYISDQDKVYNRQLAKMWKRKLLFLPSFILEPIYNCNYYLPNHEKYRIEVLTSKRERDVNNLFLKFRALNFTPEEELHGKSILKKMGLKSSDKFIIFAIRDKGYEKLKIGSSRQDWSHNNFRNFNIDDFLLAANALTKRGYFVIRLGVNVEKPIISSNPKIIDYANSEYRTDFMDIYLASKCYFCVNTSNGISDICQVFNKPVAMIVSPVGDLPTFKKNFLFITKPHFSFKKKKYLTLNEIFTSNVGFCYNAKEFKKKKIILKNLNSKEIKEFVIEFEELLSKKKIINQKEKALQRKFKLLFENNIKKFSYQKNTKLPQPMHNRHLGNFSYNFLAKNKWWIK